ncbi:hypothetical protein SUGI_0437670 [Cryptomeria japonica]|uniref:UPF0496 protein At4g34320-like n=1 Tax=Cryptomeria japonica TaxID=3369 RepID=UPI002408EBAA|nr:UPF0496 protein At4g34320-like [Cryptomeria japonica]GLJ23176.1 hypothetical protein SUGI_0437670 [Cryptomeria japonica]
MGSDISMENSGKIGQDPDFLNNYKMASKKYPDVKNIQHKLKAGIDQIIDVVENGGAQDILSLDSLKVATSWLAEKDEHLRNLILENKKDNKLFELVDLYLKLNAVTSKFYNELNNCLVRVNDKKILLEIVMECIGPANPPPGNAQYSKCKEKLQEYKAVENPFNEEFFNLLKDEVNQRVAVNGILERQKSLKDRTAKLKGVVKISGRNDRAFKIR